MNIFQLILAKLCGEELVDRHVRCPDCKERRIDLLVWNEYDVVKCTSCSCEYVP